MYHQIKYEVPSYTRTSFTDDFLAVILYGRSVRFIQDMRVLSCSPGKCRRRRRFPSCSPGNSSEIRNFVTLRDSIQSFSLRETLDTFSDNGHLNYMPSIKTIRCRTKFVHLPDPDWPGVSPSPPQLQPVNTREWKNATTQHHKLHTYNGWRQTHGDLT